MDDHGGKIVVDEMDMAEPEYRALVQERLNHMEKESIYRAVKQAGGEWVCLRANLIQRQGFEFLRPTVEFRVLVEVRPVLTEKVYVAVFERQSLPIDVYACSWCGGYTKNDDRGHCAGCGGPRNLEYIEKMRREAGL